MYLVDRADARFTGEKNCISSSNDHAAHQCIDDKP